MTTLQQAAARLRSAKEATMGLFRFDLAKRQKRLLLLGLGALPAIIVIGVALAMGIMLIGPDRSSITWYEQHGRNALIQKDYAVARLCYATLVRKKANDPEYQFGLAQSLAGLGDVGPALALIRQLAPDEGVGYLPAHLFLARQYMIDAAATDEMLDRAESHLLRVVKNEPKNQMAHTMLAGIYAKRGKWDLVNEHVSQGGSAADEIGLTAAEAFAQRRDFVSMEMWAKRAATLYSAKSKADPKDVQSRLRWAQAMALLKENEQCVTILQEGWTQTKDPIFPRYLAQAIGLWLHNSASLDAPRRLSLLEQGLAWDGQNGLLLQQLFDSRSSDAATRVVATTQPVAGAAARAFVQAIVAARSRNIDKVRSELELAFKLQPDLVLPVMANAATAWTFNKEPNAENSLLLSNALLQLKPTEAVANRAHGLILTKLEKFAHAIPYLQTGLQSMPQDRALHEAIAVCYEETGKPELAAEHRAATQPAATQPSTTQPARSSASPS